MRLRLSQWLAVAVAAALLALVAGDALLLGDEPDEERRLGTVINGIVAMPYFAMGPVLAFRLPRNTLGWVASASALWLMAGSFAKAYAAHIGSPDPSLFSLLGGLRSGLSGVGLFLFFLAIMLFPSGRLPSWRWSVVPVAVGAALMLYPGNVLTALAAFAILAVASLLLRFRRATGVERQQLKLFAYASVLVVALMGINTAIDCNSLVRHVGTCRYPILADAMWGLTFAAPPVAMTLAVLRYRLYDIDVLINRTVVYGATTATLLASYALTALVVQEVLRPITKGDEIAVAVSTLATAALIQPVRRRIQSAVDRRFYRSGYDAARTLDAFGTRLRDEVDLDALRRDLLGVVRDTMEPAHASVWLRGGR